MNPFVSEVYLLISYINLWFLFYTFTPQITEAVLETIVSNPAYLLLSTNTDFFPGANW